LQIGNMYRSQKPSKKLQMCQYSATLENLTFDMKITAKCCFIIVSKTNQNRIDEGSCKMQASFNSKSIKCKCL